MRGASFLTIVGAILPDACRCDLPSHVGAIHLTHVGAISLTIVGAILLAWVGAGRFGIGAAVVKTAAARVLTWTELLQPFGAINSTWAMSRHHL